MNSNDNSYKNQLMYVKIAKYWFNEFLLLATKMFLFQALNYKGYLNFFTAEPL